MKYIDGFRNHLAAKSITKDIHDLAEKLGGNNREARIMEVCGSHTMSIARYGIRQILPENVRLISGPGCPVCVTDAAYIDAAIELAERGIQIATFGDMLKVPGSSRTLADARGAGGKVHVCYSPLDAVKIAKENPEEEIVFLGIGFETTVPPVISIIKKANAEKLANISVLTAFKLVPPALEALATDKDVAVNGFLLPAHVSAIIGVDAYRSFVKTHSISSVIAGFEPLDILLGIKGLLEQLTENKAELVNQYARVVKKQGNSIALDLMNTLLEPADASWRGIGTIPQSGLVFRKEFSSFDASKKFDISTEGGEPDLRCRCGDVLKGIIFPDECPLFSRECTPLFPVGPCMVSSEGSCAAYYKYSR
ncbi:MAG: hydrogenase formation protein HypD [Candidatus Fermentibacteria bacterium]|nr:hydrogenase formation protein HypD [Candidatus Fermentibacteria bacterium]